MRKIIFILAVFMVIAIESNAQWNLSGNSNGTTSSVLGTTNAVPLKLTTNGIKRMIITVDGQIGIGLYNPHNIFSVKSSGSEPALNWTMSGKPVFSGFGEQNVGNADCIAALASTFYHARPTFIGRKARGTLAIPAAVHFKDYLLSLVSSGYDGTAFQNAASVDFFVDKLPTSGNVPTCLSFTTGTNSENRTERIHISSTGDISFNDSQLNLRTATGNVGIGTNRPAALLDIHASDAATPSKYDGILIPRVNNFPAQNPTVLQHGMLIFLTKQTTSGDQPGFYYWNNTGKKWNNIAEGKSSNGTAWSITGNAGTIASNNFIGTTDAAALNFKANNMKAGMIGYAVDFAETSFGYQALSSNLRGGNTAFGYRSQVYNTQGYANTSVGQYSMEQNTTGFSNTAIGSESLRQNRGGYFNTAIGQVSLGSTTTYDNTAIGRYTLLTATTGNSNTALGSAANLNNVTLSNVTLLGFYTVGTASQSVQIGNSSVTSVKAANNIVIVSDGRFKKNVEQNVPGLAFINLLQPVTYNYDVTALDKFQRSSMPALKDGDKMIADESMRQYNAAMQQKEAIRYSGFVAQDVDKVATKLGYDFSGVYKPQNDKDPYGLSYAEFVVPLVKAVQELSIENEKLKMENEKQATSFQKQLDEMKAMLLKLMNNSSAVVCTTLAGK